MSGAAPSPSGGHRITVALLAISDATAAILLAADLLVVCASVLLRYLFNAPVEWADDVARGLMVGSSFFGAASALPLFYHRESSRKTAVSSRCGGHAN